MADIFDLFKKIEKTPASTPPAAITHLVVGLGNPGREYEKTRHNAGILALTYLAEKQGVQLKRAAHKALCGEVMLGEIRALALFPQTYMNHSGEAVAAAAAFYHIPPERIIVLCDDISFIPGRIRIRRDGSHGGHNGLKNIILQLGSNAFPRIKIGVGQKPEGFDLVDFVLGRFSDGDLADISARFDNIADAVSLIANGQIDDAMMKYSK